jgi:hypothetical protein
MKKLKFILIIGLSLSIIACVDGQFYKSVRGNGNVTTEERSVSEFDALRVSTGIDVYLKQGDNISVKVEADENLHEYIETEVRGSVLHVYTNNISIRQAERKRVYVTMKEIKSLQSTSAGDIVGETAITAEDIEIGASSSGDITLELHADNVEVNISSAGSIRLTGEANMMEADLSSAGDLSASEFRVKEADVNVSSAGDADINVSESLKARASSAGDIKYSGNPKYVDAHASSAGGVHQR